MVNNKEIQFDHVQSNEVLLSFEDRSSSVRKLTLSYRGSDRDI